MCRSHQLNMKINTIRAACEASASEPKAACWRALFKTLPALKLIHLFVFLIEACCLLTNVLEGVVILPPPASSAVCALFDDAWRAGSRSQLIWLANANKLHAIRAANIAGECFGNTHDVRVFSVVIDAHTVSSLTCFSVAARPRPPLHLK